MDFALEIDRICRCAVKSGPHFFEKRRQAVFKSTVRRSAAQSYPGWREDGPVRQRRCESSPKIKESRRRGGGAWGSAE